MATKKTTNNISVGTNFPRTPELNEDTYNLYLTARENPQKDYINRLKALWDEKHPEHAQVTNEQLRERAIFVEKKKEALNDNTITDETETVVTKTAPAS